MGHKPTIYAMTGTIGAGKTTFAKQLANEKKTVVLLIDHYIRQMGPVKSKEDYDKYYFGVRNIIADCSRQLLKLGQPVVLDFGGSVGHWEWLCSIADPSAANIEIFHLLAPKDVRRERVRKRNLGPDEFHFSDEEFESMPTVSATPQVQRTGLKITVI
jgi:predicted kinase